MILLSLVYNSCTRYRTDLFSSRLPRQGWGKETVKGHFPGCFSIRYTSRMLYEVRASDIVYLLSIPNAAALRYHSKSSLLISYCFTENPFLFNRCAQAIRFLASPMIVNVSMAFTLILMVKSNGCLWLWQNLLWCTEHTIFGYKICTVWVNSPAQNNRGVIR